MENVRWQRERDDVVETGDWERTESKQGPTVGGSVDEGDEKKNQAWN